MIAVPELAFGVTEEMLRINRSCAIAVRVDWGLYCSRPATLQAMSSGNWKLASRVEAPLVYIGPRLVRRWSAVQA